MVEENQDKVMSKELETCLNQDDFSIEFTDELDTSRNKFSFFPRIKKNIFTKDGIKRILNSNRLHIIVILLVILDCTCISVELMIDFVINYNREHRNSPSLQNQNSTSRLDLFEVLKGINSKVISVLSSIEHTLRFISLFILTFFVLEIVLKLVFVPNHVIKSIWGILDAIVVFVSFILDVLLLKNKQILHTVTGLLTLFRLWRVARILSGILVTMEKKSNKKIVKLTKRIEALTTENQELREELEKNRFLLENNMNKNDNILDSSSLEML